MAVIVKGTPIFVQRRKHWVPNAGGLDRLVVTYQGNASELDAFLDSLTAWAPATGIDEDMFLSAWPDDGHPRNPSVALTYIGKKGGVLPPITADSGYNLQTAAHSQEEGMTLEVLYKSPFTQHRWISRDRSGLNEPPYTIPATGLWLTDSGNEEVQARVAYQNPERTKILTRRVNGHIPMIFRDADYVKNSLAYARASDEERTRIDTYLAANAANVAARRAAYETFLNRLFTEEERVMDFNAVEIVPGQYYECSATTSLILEPI